MGMDMVWKDQDADCPPERKQGDDQREGVRVSTMQPGRRDLRLVSLAAAEVARGFDFSTTAPRLHKMRCCGQFKMCISSYVHVA